MSGEESSPIKFGRLNTMTLTNSGWKISIKNADGTSDEVILEPMFPEAKVEMAEDVEKDVVVNRDAEHDGTVNAYPCLHLPNTPFQILNVR